MPALHCHPWIVTGIWKGNEDAGIGDRLLLHEFAAQHEVREGPIREPPQPHAAGRRRDAVLQLELAGTDCAQPSRVPAKE